MDVGQMGRKFSGRCLSPVLTTADTLAVRQSVAQATCVKRSFEDFTECWGQCVGALSQDGVWNLVRATGFPRLDELEEFTYSSCVNGDVACTGMIGRVRTGRKLFFFSSEDALELVQENSCLLLAIIQQLSIIFQWGYSSLSSFLLLIQHQKGLELFV